MTSLFERRNHARDLAAMTALTVLAGVLVLAARTSAHPPGDGPISFTAVVAMGFVALVAPLAIVVYRAARRTGGLEITVAFVTIASAALVAISKPGNLMLLGAPLILVPAIAAVWLAEAIIRQIARRRHP